MVDPYSSPLIRPERHGSKSSTLNPKPELQGKSSGFGHLGFKGSRTLS